MEINELVKRSDIEQDKKLKKRYTIFEKLIIELGEKGIPEEIVKLVNQSIKEINLFPGSNKDLVKLIHKAQSNILKLIEKELKFVPKNLYRNRWMAIGMTVFGVPFGLVFGISLNNMAFLAIGLPIGMAVGMAIGAGMDKKALLEGRQLDLEINY